MTLALIKPGGWDEEDLLTSDEMNELQAELVKALDGAGGGTYTLLAALILGGADVRIANVLRILSGAQLVVDSGGTLSLPAGAIQALAGALNVASGGAINVQNGGDINIQAGGAINLLTGALLALASGATLSISSGGALQLSGTMTVNNGAALNVANGGDVNLQSGGDLSVQGGAKISVASTGLIDVLAGGNLKIAEVDRLQIDASPFTARLSMIPFKADAGWVSSYDGRWTWTVAQGEAAQFSFPLRPGDTLLTVVVRIHGNATGGGGHGGSPPTEMPIVEVYRKDENGVSTFLASQVDTVTGGTYDTAHDITVSFGPGHSPVANNIYFIKVIAEGSPGTPGVPSSTKVLSMKFSGFARSVRGSNEVYGC